MADDNLAWSLEQFKSSKYRKRYMNHWNYYEGNQPLAFATEKFRSTFGDLFKEFADNLCPAVVDSLTERLKIIGWSSTAAETKTEDVTTGASPYKKVTVDDPTGDAAWDIWRRNKMSSRANKVHLESIKCGDSFVLVWPNKEMKVEFWPQTALEMAVEYDPNVLGRLTRAVKVWFLPVTKRWRLNVYLPDRVDKYVTQGEHPNGIPALEGQWVRGTDDGTPSVLPNPWGRVPVFHFSNRCVYERGISDLKDVLPIQDALNKAVMDMMIAMEFASFKQRYIIGLEAEVDENSGEPLDPGLRNTGVDRMMSVPGDKNEIAVGQFEATDLSQFRLVQNDFRAEVARVSGTPLHYFYITTGDFPSGEAIKSAEARFVSRIESRQEDWGPVWGEAILFALQIEQTAGLADGTEMVPLWKDSSPRSESELADTAVKKKTVGVSRSQILKELGYDDETIQRMLEEADAYAQSEADLAAQQRGPAAGAPGTPPNGAGGGTPAARQAASQARRQGRVPGVKS